MATLAERFVNVRMQSINGVNLNQFPFEYDLTWMAFFQDAQGRTYTRYGGREDHDAESHLNKASLLAVMRQVLRLHEQGDVQPDSRYEPVAKSVHRPEDIPPMKAMLSKRKVKCIHCHDVKAAMLRDRRDRGLLKKDMVFTYPSPRRLGIHLDPFVQNKVRKVEANSPGDSAGIRKGDMVQTIDGQRVMTFADATRVLELAPKTAGVARFVSLRDGRPVAATVQLVDGWRKSADPSWRSSTGVVGPPSGIWGKRASDQQRASLGVAADRLALRVTYIWAPWAKQAGIKNGDYIVSVDGYQKDMTIRQFQAYLHLNRNWGDTMLVTVRRGKREVDLTFRLPDNPPR